MGVRLDWTDNADNEDGIRVERKRGVAPFALIQTINTPDVIMYIDPDGIEDDIYRVLAFNAFGDSVYSNGAVARPPSTAWKELDFEAYADTAALRADVGAGNTFAAGWDIGLDGIFLDTGVGYSAAGLTKSMRYDYVDQGCGTIFRARGWPLPTTSQDVWIEQAVRFSSNATASNPACPPPDWKWIFGALTPSGFERWDFMVARGMRMTSPWGAVADPVGGIVVDHGDDGKTLGFGIDPPGPSAKARIDDGGAFQYDVDADLFNNVWHTLGIHWRHPTRFASDPSPTYDAYMGFWFDGVFAGSLTGFTHGGPISMKNVLLGQNKDKGQDSGTESAWIGRVRVWDTKPNWDLT